jgi:DNA polymerase-1
MVLRLLLDFHPSHIAVAFDRPGGTFRNELYPDYQSQRPQMEDDFISQIHTTHEVIQTMGIAIYEQDGFEADDVIGTIVEKVKKEIKDIDQVIIVTGDRDILQLVEDDRVLVYMPVKGLSEAKLYASADVVQRLGILPEQIIPWKALCGDSSDNYPGVAGIGPKTAATLVKEFGSVEHIYACLPTRDKRRKIS